MECNKLPVKEQVDSYTVLKYLETGKESCKTKSKGIGKRIWKNIHIKGEADYIKKEKVNAVAENKRRSNSEFKMEWMNAGRKSVS